jgi:hypothetical protein
MIQEAELVREIESLDGVLRTLRAAVADDRSETGTGNVRSAGDSAGIRGSSVPPAETSVPRAGTPPAAEGFPESSSVPPEEPGSTLWRAILDQHATNRALLAERRREVGDRLKDVRVPRGARSVYRQRDTGSRIDVTR